MENNNPSPTTSPQFGCFYRWPGSSRWTFDRGAMPGEPFAFLDGDQDSAMAAIFELQSPGKATVFEVRGTEGHVICRGEFPSCVAMAAERRIDNSVHLKRVLDARDYELAQAAFTNRESIDKPRIGDYVSFATGELERLSHDWDDGFQTSPTGAFFLSASGRGSLSCGGLNPLVLACIPPPKHGASFPGRCAICAIPARGKAISFAMPKKVFLAWRMKICHGSPPSRTKNFRRGVSEPGCVTTRA